MSSRKRQRKRAARPASPPAVNTDDLEDVDLKPFDVWLLQFGNHMHFLGELLKIAGMPAYDLEQAQAQFAMRRNALEQNANMVKVFPDAAAPESLF